MTELGQLSGDSAKERIDQDEFGLGPMSEALASVLTRQIDLDGYVIGLTGDWGSGKSSLVNFVIERIKKIAPGHRVIKFDPWLIGKRDTLLFSFFGQLASEIESQLKEIGPSSGLAGLRWKYAYGRLANKIRLYGSYAGRASATTAPVSALDPTGMTGLWSATLAVLVAFSNLFSRRRKTLTEQRAEIREDLTAIWNTARGTRFTIVIDDMDRLEPEESVELLRLVSKVADFPQVTYILCVDPVVLANQIRTELDVEDGHVYLEKVIQNFVSIPPQEPFALRRYFRSRLAEEFPMEVEYDDPRDGELRSRKASLFDTWIGEFVKTPRDANRILDGVRLVWPHMKNQGDFFDLVWLQVIKLKCPELHRWTKNYVQEIGAYRDGGRASGGVREYERLQETLKALGWGDPRHLFDVGVFLPGVTSFSLEDGKKRVFKFDPGEKEKFESFRRLGSPLHWRLYFAFDQPSYAVDNDQVAQFRNAVSEDTQDAINILRELLDKPHDRGGHHVGLLLDRLNDVQVESFSPNEVKGLIKVFAEIMDEFALKIGPDEMGRFESWSTATRLVQSVSAGLEKSEVVESFLAAIDSSASVNWIADVIRDQGFAHGIPDPDGVREDHQWMDKEHLDLSVEKVTARFRDLGLAEILKKPEPLEILYCWVQLGDEDELRRIWADYIEDDSCFLEAVQATAGWSLSSQGVTRPIRSRYLESFMDVSEARTRLEQMASSSSLESELVVKAKRLLNSWSGG